MDQTIQYAIIAGIEKSINTALTYDPATKKKIAKIHDILAINITSPLATTLYIRGQENGVAIMSYCEETVTSQLEGPAFAFLNLLNNPHALANSGVSLTGSTQLLQQWQTIIETLDIDWEDALSEVIGDIAGPIASKGIKQYIQWWQQQAQEHQRLIAEYLPEELRVVPSKPEVDGFINDISDLNLHVDRIAARVNRIQQAWLDRQKTHTP
ncbi:MAG: ubiquinone biosynthesis protein UbiJ [Granulosicoccus sp.]|jgi:ubiquinone biosynthesis protein UbiJ